MALKIIALILNVLILILSFLTFIGGGWCFGIFGGLAGVYNLFAIWKGVDLQDNKLNIFGLLANALVFLNGVFALFQVFSHSGDGIGGSITAGMLWAIALVFLSTGIITVIVVSKDSYR